MLKRKEKYLEIKQNHPHMFSNQDAGLPIIDDETEIRAWQKKRMDQLNREKEPIEWADIGVVLDDPYIIVLRDLVRFPDGNTNGYIRLINRAELYEGPSVVVLPRLGSDYLLIYRYRHATRSWEYEVPRGFGKPYTTSEQQANNEIREEIGGEIYNLINLGNVHNNTGIEGNNVILFLAELKSFGKPQVEEAIDKIIPVSLETLEQMIASTEISDGFTIAAYTRAKLKGLLR